MKTAETILTDEQINKAWGNANFGDISKRQVIVDALEHFAKGYKPGSTAQAIVKELGLVEREYLTDKGYEYLIASYQPAALQSYPAEEQAKMEGNRSEIENYWRNRCIAAELFIKESPCDPDITQGQIAAHDIWQELNHKPVPPSPTSEKPGGLKELICDKCGCNKHREEYDQFECINCHKITKKI